jgi:hypothetical protein
MALYPDTLLSISGDVEVELTFERNLEEGERRRRESGVFYADYSPFMIAEFRDSLRDTRYAGDLTPASDDNRDGRTFNKDYDQQFKTWALRHFNDSGPIPYEQYAAMAPKLPRSGPYYIADGFDAPRVPQPGKSLWEEWKRFREQVISNYVRDFTVWLAAESQIPASRIYTHQIPAEFLFGQIRNIRIETSASGVKSAFVQPIASPGVTAYNTYSGQRHSKTATPALFDVLAQSGLHWGILEYNPSVPAIDDEHYYMEELRQLAAYRPRLIVPFAWTNLNEHSRYRIQDTAFERALQDFVRSYD